MKSFRGSRVHSSVQRQRWSVEPGALWSERDEGIGVGYFCSSAAPESDSISM